MGIGRPRIYELPKIGNRYGQWVVVANPVRVGKSAVTSIPCRCDCGTEAVIYYPNLYRNASKGCGCERVQKLLERNTNHGETRTRLYNTWCSIKARCSSPTGISASTYFERGIKVCDEWISNYTAFGQWSKQNGYQDDLVLDRKDTNGGYSPDNCRWVTQKVNSRNSRANRMITAWGETKCVASWGDDPRCNITLALLYARIRRGIPPEIAITKPHAWTK